MIANLIILFFSMIVQVIIPPIPAEIIVIAAGKTQGVFLTTLIAGTGLWIGSILVYYMGKSIHSKFDKFFSKKKVTQILKKFKQYKSILLWIRILPYNPSDIISYSAGIAKVDKRKFLSITLITSYVRCFSLALLGSVLTSFKSVFTVLVILIISAIGAHLFLRKDMHKVQF